MVVNRKKFFISVIIFILLFFGVKYSYGQEEIGYENKEIYYTREYGIFTGWADGSLKEQEDYQMIPIYLQFGFDAKPIFSKINIKPQGSINFIVEPFLNTVISPSSNIETGCDFILKYRHPLTNKLQFYIEGGLGLMWSSQHTYEQGTQFNFTEQAGVGFSYFFSRSKSLNIGYRYRHFSNAGIEEPNAGVDMDYFLCGISIYH